MVTWVFFFFFLNLFTFRDVLKDFKSYSKYIINNYQISLLEKCDCLVPSQRNFFSNYQMYGKKNKFIKCEFQTTFLLFNNVYLQ